MTGRNLDAEASQIIPIVGTMRDYAWGSHGEISRALGRSATDEIEAEYWLGAHPSAPSMILGGSPPADNLASWEQRSGKKFPFLLKLLAAASPLSLQAHPNAAQALAGFAREEAQGLAIDAPTRSYKDPHAKPEMIVALEDGLQALCGFRPVNESIDTFRGLVRDTEDAEVAEHGAWAETMSRWIDRLQSEGIERAFHWLLTGGEAALSLVEAVTRAAHLPEARISAGNLAEGEREVNSNRTLIQTLSSRYPGDPGIVAALLLHQVTLRAGEALWLPAGNIHAYLHGIGIELMGPSDNVLRGGLTPKYVDADELQRVLDFAPRPLSRLEAQRLGPHLEVYRPSTTDRDAPIALYRVTGEATIATKQPAIMLCLDGQFEIRAAHGAHEGTTGRLAAGNAAAIGDPGEHHIRGKGLAFLATGAA